MLVEKAQNTTWYFVTDKDDKEYSVEYNYCEINQYENYTVCDENGDEIYGELKDKIVAMVV